MRLPLLPRLAPLLALLAGLAPAPAARALLNIDGTRNQVFVFGGVTYGYSSNMFAQAGGASDSVVTAEVGAELKRRAGIISVDGTLKFDFVRYGRFTDGNGVNPNLLIDFVKSAGRTTGTLSLQVFRETRSDSAVNLRTTSWNYSAALTVRYPLNEKLQLGSTTGYERRDYTDRSLGLVNYQDYNQAVDVFYSYTQKLDFIAGYRLRVSHTPLHDRTYDHWLNFGATGSLLAKLTGSLRVGYQLRNVRDTTGSDYHHVNFLASLNWPVTRKLALSFEASRDFNTIATGQSVDSTSLGPRAQYTYNRNLYFTGGLAYGRNDFLDASAADRRDTFFTWDAGAHYRLNEHLQFGGSYTYLRNWSSLVNADYENHGFSVDVTARY